MSKSPTFNNSTVELEFLIQEILTEGAASEHQANKARRAAKLAGTNRSRRSRRRNNRKG